jgi:hypothetical protein
VEDGEGVGVWDGTGVKVNAGVTEGEGLFVAVVVAERCAPVELHALDARRKNKRKSSRYMKVL